MPYIERLGRVTNHDVEESFGSDGCIAKLQGTFGLHTVK